MVSEKKDKKGGRIVYYIRKETGLNQVEFGEKIGIQKSYVSNLEAGRKELSITKFFTICDLFNVVPEKIIKEYYTQEFSN